MIVRIFAERCRECSEAYYSPGALQKLERVREDFARKVITPLAVGQVYEVS